MEGAEGLSSLSGGEDNAADPDGHHLPMNMEMTHLQNRRDVFSQGEDISAAVIQQTINALPIAPEVVSNVRGPVLKLKRVDSTSVDVKVVHSFTAHYAKKPPQCEVTEHTNSPRLSARAHEHGSFDRDHSADARASKDDTEPLPVAGSSVDNSSLMDIIEDGIDCEPVVIEFEEADAPADGQFSGCGCPDQSIWELDASRIQMGRRIGVGGFSEVFVAKYEGTLVAVKRLLSTGQETAQQLCSEVTLLAKLRHPNLLLFMGYTIRPEFCIVSEFMARGSLFNILRLQKGKLLEPRLQRVIAISVARGMLYLHTRNPPILHLDLKSPNILVDDRWRVKIGDFGLSKVRARTFVSTSVGNGAGTPEWMAPEMLRCEKLDDRADVYSFGVVLWEILTGEAPWEALNAMQVVGAVGFAGKSLPEPTTGDPFLISICKACIMPQPCDRPSFQQIVDSLDAHFAAKPLQPALNSVAASPQHLLPSPHPAAPPPICTDGASPSPSPNRQSITPVGRRRERSPDCVDESPPAINTRLANGAKYPSPRLPTPTEPFSHVHLGAALTHPLDPNSTTVPQSPRPHRQRSTTPTQHAWSQPLSFQSLPNPLHTYPAARPHSPAPTLRSPSAFAPEAHTPWNFPTNPQATLTLSPFAASAAQTQPLSASHPPPPSHAPPSLISPFATCSNPASNTLPPAPTSTSLPPTSLPTPFAAVAATPYLAQPPSFSTIPSSHPSEPFPPAIHLPAESPVRAWLQSALVEPHAIPLPEAGSTSPTSDPGHDPMQADFHLPAAISHSPALHAPRADPKPSPRSNPIPNLKSTYLSSTLSALTDPSEPQPPPHASSRSTSPTVPAPSQPPTAIDPSMLSPFFTHQLSTTPELQELMRSAAHPPPLPPSSPHPAADKRNGTSLVDVEDVEHLPSFSSLDEKTLALLRYASSARCYHTGRFRVTHYDIHSPQVSEPTPVTAAASSSGAAASSSSGHGAASQPSGLQRAASRECCISSSPDDADEDDDAGMPGSCTMYKRGRFFIKSFCQKGGRACVKMAVPKSAMLHTASTGLVCTTSPTMHEAHIAACTSPRTAAAMCARAGGASPAPLLRRSLSAEGIVAAVGLPATRSSDDDLYDQHSPQKTPRNGVPAAAVPAPVLLKDLEALAKAAWPQAASTGVAGLSLSPSSSVGTDSSHPHEGSLHTCGATPRSPNADPVQPAVVECRQYLRGRFNVQENVVVSGPTSPPPATAAFKPPTPRPPSKCVPVPRLAITPTAPTPAVAAYGPGALSQRQAGRFTIVEQPCASKPQSSNTSSSGRLPTKAKASPRVPAATSQETGIVGPPKLKGRFKVYEDTTPPSTSPRPRPSPRTKDPMTTPRGSSRTAPSPRSANNSHIAAALASLGTHTIVSTSQAPHGAAGFICPPAEATSSAATPGSSKEYHSTGTAASSGMNNVGCHVEVECSGCEPYSICVDVMMGHCSGDAVGADQVMADQVMADALPDAASVGGGAVAEMCSCWGDEGATSVVQVDLAAEGLGESDQARPVICAPNA